MEKITYRQLQRLSSQELVERLPVGITVDSQGVAIILSADEYRRILQRLDSQPKGTQGEGKTQGAAVRPYDSRKRYNPGDKVLILRGRGWVETVIPELDGEGNPIHEEW